MVFKRFISGSLSQFQRIHARFSCAESLISPVTFPSQAPEVYMPFYRRYSSKYLLPEHVDWREKKAVSPIKNQRTGCQTSVIFTCLGAIEGLEKIKTGKLEALSVQHILDLMLKQLEPSWKYSYGDKLYLRCSFAPIVLRFILNNGVTTEAAHPYFGYASNRTLKFRGNLHRIKGFEKIAPNEDLIKQRVAKQPVIAAIKSEHWPRYGWKHDRVYFDFSSPRIPYEFTPFYTDHAVLIVGYGEQEGNKYWIIKNSWGEKFGNKGYVKIARDQNAFGIATYAWYPIL